MTSADHSNRFVARHAGGVTGRLALVLGAVLVAGCASFSEDGGFGVVERSARDRLAKDLQWVRTPAEQQRVDARVEALLAQPLTSDDAVQVALLKHRGLQAAFAELGIAEAETVQAGRLPNPGFTFGRLRRGDELELERGLHLNLARLLAMPLVQQVQARRFEQVQAGVAAAVLEHAGLTRKAWVQAVAAAESARYAAQVMQAAEAGAELARRMAQVGNFNTIQLAREQSFYADAALGLARAQRLQQAARERLTRLLGLWGEQAQFRLPERLPELPPAPRELPDVERLALSQRLDVQAARAAAAQTARNLGLTQATRFVNVLELGAVRNGSSDAPTQRGWEIALELPLFDWGDARVARAEAVYRQALDRAAATAIDARSEVREAYGGYRSAWDIARHLRDEVVPLRARIAQENVLRYNAMLIGVFGLLADARAQTAGVGAAIEALRDFWIAEADLDMALVGKPALAMPAGPAAMTAGDGGSH